MPRLQIDKVEGCGLVSTHFHATYVHPTWAKDFKRTEKIGQHIFYRNA